MKQYSIVVIFLFIAFMHTSAVHAEPDCMKTVHSEEEINVCQSAAAKQLELDIFDLEKAIRSRFKSPQIERFDEAQRRWEQMTEKDCEIESNFYEGAAIYIAIRSECLQRHYQDRLQTLKRYVCPEHNLGNGCEKDNSASAPATVELPTANERIKSSKNKPPKIKNTKRFR